MTEVEVVSTQDPSSFEHAAECTGCESQLKAHLDGLYKPPSEPMRPGNVYFFDCPVCSTPIMLPTALSDQVETLKQVQDWREKNPQ